MSSTSYSLQVGKVLLVAVLAGIGLAIAYVLIFVIAASTDRDLPVSTSWVYGALFATPVVVVTCVLCAGGALVANRLPSPRRWRTLLGGLLGGSLGLLLIVLTGIPSLAVAFFGVAVIGESAVLATALSTDEHRLFDEPRGDRSA